MTQWLTGEVGKIQALVLLIAVLAVIAVTVMTFVRTRAALPPLITLVSGGLILWGLNNTSWFQQKAGQETNGMGAVIGGAGRAVSVGVHAGVGVIAVHGPHLAALVGR